MTSFFANSLVYISHKLDTVSAFLTSSRPFLNSSIVPVIMSKDEIWNGLTAAPNAVKKEAKLLTLFKESDTLQFSEKLIFKSDENSELVEHLLQHLVDNTRYFTRTLSKIALPSPYAIEIISGKLTNLTALDLGAACTDITDTDLEMISEFPLLEHLDLGCGGCDQITDEGISQLSKLQSLKKLVLIGLEKITSLSFLKEMKSLKTLDIAECADLDNDALGAEGECFLPPSLTDVFLGDDLPDECLHRLKWCSVDIASLSCTQVSAATIETLSTSFPNLKKLELTSCEDELDTEGFAILSKNFARLESLHIEGCASEIADGLAALSKKCKQLQKLELSNCTLLDDKCLEHLSQISSPLSELIIDTSPKVSDGGFGRLTQLKYLEKLHITSLQNTQFTCDIGEDRTFSTTLQFLKIEYCDAITDKGLKSLIKGLSLKEFGATGVKLLTTAGLATAFEACSSRDSLESLHIGGFFATDLRFLCGMTNLTTCYVYGVATRPNVTPSTDEEMEKGFVALSRMTKLESLFLINGTFNNNKSFGHLSSLSNCLKTLNVASSRIEYSLFVDTVSKMTSLVDVNLSGLDFNSSASENEFAEKGLLAISRRLPYLRNMLLSCRVIVNIKTDSKLENELMQVLPTYYP